MAPERLELEVTGSALIQDGEAAIAALRQLCELGVRIALDDFGTGYSSLSYVGSFSCDRIKMDRCFVSDLSGEGAASQAIVGAVAQMGTNISLATTAGGVETQEQLNLLRANGYTAVQGYLFSPPKPAEDIRPMLDPASGDAVHAA